jgi:hypothetical protein
VIHIESNVGFGMKINAQGTPSKEQIFDIFQKNFKNFWIEAEIVKDEKINVEIDPKTA